MGTGIRGSRENNRRRRPANLYIAQTPNAPLDGELDEEVEVGGVHDGAGPEEVRGDGAGAAGGEHAVVVEGHEDAHHHLQDLRQRDEPGGEPVGHLFVLVLGWWDACVSEHWLADGAGAGAGQHQDDDAHTYVPS